MQSIDQMSDADLVSAVAATVRRPRREPADSFVLHAPLELAARAALLPRVTPDARPAARRQIAAIAPRYESFGPGVAEPKAIDFDSAEDAATRLGEAVAAGDLDDVDAVAQWLGRRTSASEIRALLADLIVPSLAAAAHGTIFLFQLPRISPRGELTVELLRPLARELARQPEWRLRRFEDRPSDGPQSAETLFAALQATPRLGVPGSDFIYPLMSQVERTGVAEALLALPTGNVDFDAGARVILRAAALSMLQESGEHAPYGWSHCLTLPQAALGVAPWCADPTIALAVAATYVVGFRAALAHAPLDGRYAPPVPRADLVTALEDAPEEAAAAVWHAPSDRMAGIATTLASRAAVHRDAHLVKYTLACLDAAAWDRDSALLYLSAAAALHGWWAEADASTRDTAASARSIR